MNVCPEASDLPSADDPEVQEELRAWMMGAAERELSAETSSHSKQSPTITENNNNISPGILSQNKLSASCRSCTYVWAYIIFRAILSSFIFNFFRPL